MSTSYSLRTNSIVSATTILVPDLYNRYCSYYFMLHRGETDSAIVSRLQALSTEIAGKDVILQKIRLAMTMRQLAFGKAEISGVKQHSSSNHRSAFDVNYSYTSTTRKVRPFQQRTSKARRRTRRLRPSYTIQPRQSGTMVVSTRTWSTV
jgi:hypothetical protein